MDVRAAGLKQCRSRVDEAGLTETPMQLRRLRTAIGELWFDVRLQALRRREREALIRLGAAAASSGVKESGELKRLLVQVRDGKLRLDELRRAISASLEADRTDFLAASRWMQPVVVLRGISSRAVLRHQIALSRRSLMTPHEALGSAMAQDGKAGADLPEEFVSAVVKARWKLRSVSDERSRQLAPYGGSALPKWFPSLGSETKALGLALWMQLKPHILPRSPAVVGLAIGWWVATTYTDSHFRSVLNSLGIGGGGRRVVAGETYRAMAFWLPILGAALCAYLADRARFLVHRRYNRLAQDRETATP